MVNNDEDSYSYSIIVVGFIEEDKNILLLLKLHS